MFRFGTLTGQPKLRSVHPVIVSVLGNYGTSIYGMLYIASWKPCFKSVVRSPSICLFIQKKILLATFSMFGKVAILNALVSAVSAGMSFALNSFTHYSNTVLMLSQAPSFGMAASTR
jgi:hypothetical protein